MFTTPNLQCVGAKGFNSLPLNEKEISENTEAFYIMRDEGILIFKDIRKKLNLASVIYDQKFESIHRFYIDRLTALIQAYMSKSSIRTKVVLHNLQDMEVEKRKYIGNLTAISLDSYSLDTSSIQLCISRLFNALTSEYVIGARPGYPDISIQLLKFVHHNQREYVLVDDDTFTGSTLREVIRMLKAVGINIVKAVVGVQVGEITLENIPVESLYHYESRELANVGDPRDFLLGMYEGGLAVTLSTGEKGRVPYILPFIDMPLRLDIPRESVVVFSQECLLLNYQVFEKMNSLSEIPVQLQHLWSACVTYLTKVYGIEGDQDILELIEQLCIVL
jgi:hypothetical protein